MPIDYKKYPPNWSEIRKRILERSENKCECCGLENHSEIFSYKDFDNKTIWQKEEPHNWLFDKIKKVKVVLTIAHLDHDETNHNVTDDRLKAMCKLCHLRYDVEEKKLRKRTFQGLSENCQKGSNYCSQSSENCDCWEKHRKQVCKNLKISFKT